MKKEKKSLAEKILYTMCVSQHCLLKKKKLSEKGNMPANISKKIKKNGKIKMFKNILRSLTIAIGLIATIIIIMGTSRVAFAIGAPGSASQDMTGSLAVTGSSSSLAIAAPASLAFTGATQGGSAQDITNTAGSFLLDVTDATGLAGGWDVSLGATTFVHNGNKLNNDGTLTMTGLNVTDLSTNNSASQPDSSVPALASHFPVAITTAPSSPTPTPIYSVGALSGMGTFQLDTQLSLFLPANTVADTYSSTMTVAIASSIE